MRTLKSGASCSIGNTGLIAGTADCADDGGYRTAGFTLYEVRGAGAGF
jgi:hypothetical protein